ncbi:MAG: squalene--hopene cyclase [Gammaproteobacteria bacterium]|nr:squalene--hopene cyclase [Gammaproteobacteria bacterium]MDH3411253.1 squalene--hopene cyclase [Gammaproteobacteria bacterium]
MADLRLQSAVPLDIAPPAATSKQDVRSDLDAAIARGLKTLQQEQHAEGYWCYEFEADCTIPAEYILMMHFMDEVDEALEQKIAVYLRSHQADDGGWPLYYGGVLDLSCSVKAYYALKLAGDDPQAPHMIRAREAILENGGAACANVFTRITLALFAQVPWRAVPFIPVEIMLLPRWFPFHIRKVSYWSRTVMVPLFVLCSLKPKAANPKKVDILELFVNPPNKERNYFPIRSKLNLAFFWLDRMGRFLEPLVPGFVRKRAIRGAADFIIERLNGEHGLGGIFPAMVNAHEMLAVIGYPKDHPYRIYTKRALQKLLVLKQDHAYCQSCVSPVWDTSLACLTVQEASGDGDHAAVLKSLDWLKPLQLLSEPGDWQWQRPNLRGGGWAFEFRNDHYPDVDDTPVVAWAMLQSGKSRYRESIERAAEWICGMQSKNGGFGSFDVNNTRYYLNEIPFADHGALLDPPTSDVTARCVTFLSKLDRERFRPTIDAALEFLKQEQEQEGCWFGRWGTNFTYGTWSVLLALEAAGEQPEQAYVRRAVNWLKNVQREDGGWGESNVTYFEPQRAGQHIHSTSFQTAWALLGLMAAGEVRSESVARGIEYLRRTRQSDGLWFEPDSTAPGFPRVFYLKYHGYSRYFPLWALARFRTLTGPG